MLRDFGITKEMQMIREKARYVLNQISKLNVVSLSVRGQMKSTPLTVQNKGEEYTRLRTSKVMKDINLQTKSFLKVTYLSEDYDKDAAKLSKRVSLALNMVITGAKYASENYQVMNYGLGGSITGHLDTSRDGQDSEQAKYGGQRLVSANENFFVVNFWRVLR